MSKVIIIGLAAAILGAATSADAAVSISSTPYNTGFDPAAASAVVTFDAALPAGFTRTGGSVRTVTDSLGAQPSVAPGVRGTTNYWSINAGNPGVLTFDGGYRTVSLLWGSIDTYNTLSLLNQDGTVLQAITGNQIPPANGNQTEASTNRRVTFTSDAGAIYGLRLQSTSPAFEVDDIAVAQPVPEPATWAMMILGFGAIGGTLRTRRRQLVLA
jgi:hypothetical protein